MKYPMGKCVWLGLYQGLKEVGKFCFGRYMKRRCNIFGNCECVCSSQNSFYWKYVSSVTSQEWPFQGYHKVQMFFPGHYFTSYFTSFFLGMWLDWELFHIQNTIRFWTYIKVVCCYCLLTNLFHLWHAAIGKEIQGSCLLVIAAWQLKSWTIFKISALNDPLHHV